MRRTDHPAGIVHRLMVDGTSLRGNLLGDPTLRVVDVYVPHGHDGAGLPLLVDLVGFTAGGPAHTNWRGFGENVPTRLDRLIGSGAMPPVVVAFPDCFTRLGGNQYVNSPVTGQWEDFLVDEMLPEVETRFGCGGSGRRGVFGKSSGGYGTLVHALRRSDVWSAAASHSGDAGFEFLYLPEFPNTLRALAEHELSIEAWMRAFEAKPKIGDKDMHIIMILAQAASFDPDPTSYLGLRLPVDLETCELIPERWANWLAWDPVTLVETHGKNLAGMKAVYIDCGTIDQYNIVYGSRRLHRSLERQGVPHRYEEFPDNHSSVDYRMDESLPMLAKALAG
jgi:hypothetical protein